MRVRISIFCILSLLAVSVRAQQSTISYQGAIANTAGMPADSGTYFITVSFYTDESGTQPLWQDTFGTFVKNGIFNIALGSSRPLPPPSVLDRPIWVGVRVGNMAESRPLNRLTAVPMAMNVADSAITSAKMATDYVSSISVNGQKVTGQATNLNIIGGDGINLNYDDASKSLVLNAGATSNSLSGKGAKAETSDTTEYWSETGNHSVPPPHYYLGTSDSEGFEIHVNNNGDTNAGNGRVMRYEPMPTSPNVIGGFRTNDVSSGVYGATIAGGGSEADSNIVLGNFGTISGGNGNTAYDGATIGGGDMNSASEGATVAGGSGNSAFQGGTVSGGGPNFADNWATVGGGVYNLAGGNYATVGGGSGNTAEASVSLPMTYPGQYSTISGGFSNTIYGTAGAIPGGAGMSIGSYSFAFNGDSSFLAFGSGITDLTAVTGIAYFGDVNLMIGNVDSVARQLRFYGPNTDHTYGSGAKFTSFQAPLMDSDVFYVLPKAQGDTNTVLTEDGHGNLSWASQLGALDWSITGNFSTSPPTNFIGTLDSQAFEIHIHNNTLDTSGGNQRVMRYEEATYSPNIVGGSSANSIDTGLSGAAILSGGTLEEPNYISANFSVISGGYNNIIDSGAYGSTIGGGNNNTVESYLSTVGGGDNNTIEKYSDYSVIAGGYKNTIHDTSSAVVPTEAVIGGGALNLIFNCIATIAGGTNNSIYSGFSSIGGGSYVTINSNSPYGTIAGGVANTIDSNSDHVTIGGGGFNTIGANANYATIAGGDTNTIGHNSDHATIAGGGPNTVNSPFSAIGGGSINTIDTASDHATIAGGDSNTIASEASFASILGGKNNLVQDSGSVITGGLNNSIEFTNSTHPSENGFIGAGTHNRIDGSGDDTTKTFRDNNSAIVAGLNNTIHSGRSFIGAGAGDTIYEAEDFIGAGDSNTVNANFSGMVTGWGNAILLGGYNSFIGTGSQDTIGINAHHSAIVAGQNNSIKSTFSFEGAGAQNTILSSFSGIVAGISNMIGDSATSSFIGAGGNDTVLAIQSYIGAGNFNVTDTGASKLVGSFASIPGGDHLRTQSYAQTAFGFYNVPAGATIDPYAAHSAAHGDDPLIIVGRGLPDTLIVSTEVARDSDAALISNNGHISAFQNIGDGGALGGTENTHMGTIYSNNTIIACGNVQGFSTGFTLLYDIGVCSITRSGASYLIDIHKVTNQDAVTVHTFIPNDCAITASISQGATGTAGMISVQPITSGGTFHITTFNSSGQPDSLLGFMFQVVAR